MGYHPNNGQQSVNAELLTELAELKRELSISRKNEKAAIERADRVEKNAAEQAAKLTREKNESIEQLKTENGEVLGKLRTAQNDTSVEPLKERIERIQSDWEALQKSSVPYFDLEKKIKICAYSVIDYYRQIETTHPDLHAKLSEWFDESMDHAGDWQSMLKTLNKSEDAHSAPLGIIMAVLHSLITTTDTGDIMDSAVNAAWTNYARTV